VWFNATVAHKLDSDNESFQLKREDGNKNDRVKSKTHLRYLDQMLSVVWKLQDKLH